MQLDIFNYTDAENMRPHEFEARFEPRSSEIAAVIQKNADEARERLARWDGQTKVRVDQFVDPKIVTLPA